MLAQTVAHTDGQTRRISKYRFVYYWATVCKTVRRMLSVSSSSFFLSFYLFRLISAVCPVSMSVTLVYCGQTVEWIRMPLGMDVGLGPGDIVLDGDPAPPKRDIAPIFRLMSIVAKRSPISATAELLLLLSSSSTLHRR